ncbi:MAG: hypothetical protein IPO91_34515 [Chloroflexi bacterium]|nr:hypothetical protein [Chloroflexota bacterium]
MQMGICASGTGWSDSDGYAAAWVSTIEPIDVVEDELRRLLDMQKALTASSQAIEGRISALIDGK